MDNPEVTIVIPTFNRSELLPRAIDTALSQTYRCEVLVVDHGSQQQTIDVVSSYGNKITYVRKNHDLGPIAAWIDGVISATGEFIHFTFDDDWLADSFIEKCMSRFTDRVGLVFSNASIVSQTGEGPNFPPHHSDLNSGDSQRLIRFLMHLPLAISPGCAIFRKVDVLQALLRNPVLNSKPYHGAGPDLLMYLYCLHRYPEFGFIDERLAFFRAHAGSITVNALASVEKSRDLTDAYSEYKKNTSFMG